ncbi:MAG: hypothetical protein FH751_09815 [Firmicutes bacterium]|nr:hypothetical protein [Bacillota bacterium]
MEAVGTLYDRKKGKNMKFIEIETTSKWKEKLKHVYIVQESQTLLVTLPGYAYESVAPLFYYVAT